MHGDHSPFFHRSRVHQRRIGRDGRRSRRGGIPSRLVTLRGLRWAGCRRGTFRDAAEGAPTGRGSLRPHRIDNPTMSTNPETTEDLIESLQNPTTGRRYFRRVGLDPWVFGTAAVLAIRLFVPRISRGRSIRLFVTGVLVVPSVNSLMWSRSSAAVRSASRSGRNAVRQVGQARRGRRRHPRHQLRPDPLRHAQRSAGVRLGRGRPR